MSAKKNSCQSAKPAKSVKTANLLHEIATLLSITSVLWSRNYLFSAPAPSLSIILAPTPAPATAIYSIIYCHFPLTTCAKKYSDSPEMFSSDSLYLNK